MLFSPGSRAGICSDNCSSTSRRAGTWRLPFLITVVAETSLPKAQPISGVVVDSSVPPLKFSGKGDSNATEPVTRPTVTAVDVELFHLEHEASPNVPDTLPREAGPQATWQEVEVLGTHLAREPVGRSLRSKGSHKLLSSTLSKQNQFWMTYSRRVLEATYGFIAVAMFGWICLMYPQTSRDADSSRRTSSPPPPPCSLPPSWGPEMEPRYPFSSWVRDVRKWEEKESQICAQRRAHKVFAQLTASARELVQDIPVQQLTQAHRAQGRVLDPVSQLLTVMAERNRRRDGNRPSYTDLILEFTWGNARTYDEVLYKFDTLVMHARAEENFSMPRAGLANLLMKACGISNTERLLIRGHFGGKHPETAKEFEEFLEVMRPLARKPQTRTVAIATQNAGVGHAAGPKGAGKDRLRPQDSTVQSRGTLRSLSSQGLNIQADEFHPGTDTTGAVPQSGVVNWMDIHPGTDTTGAVPQSGVVNWMDIHPGTDTTGAVPQSGVVNVPLFRNQARMVQRTDGSFHIIRPRSPETRSEWSGPGSPKVVLPKPYLTGFTVPRPKPKPPDPPPIAGSSAASSSYEIQAIYEDVDWSEARVAPNPSRTSKSVTFSQDIVECRDSLDDLSSSSSSSSAVATFVPIPGTATSVVDEAEMLKLTPRSGMDRPTMTGGEIEYFMINIEDENVSRKLAWDKCRGCSGRYHQSDSRHSHIQGECLYPVVDAFAPPCRTYSVLRAGYGHQRQNIDTPEDPRVLGTWKRCPGCVNRFPATHSLHTFLVGECLSSCILDAEIEVSTINDEREGEASSEACLEPSQADNQLLEHPVWQMCRGCTEELPLHHPVHSRVIGECRFPFAESEQTDSSAVSSSKVSTLATEAHEPHISPRNETAEESLSEDTLRRIQAMPEDRPESESETLRNKCMICTEWFRDKELMQMLVCGHTYHVKCWQNALMRHDARVVRVIPRATMSSQERYDAMPDDADMEAICPSCGKPGHATVLFTCIMSRPADYVQATRTSTYKRRQEDAPRGSAPPTVCAPGVVVEEDERSSFPISPCLDDTMEPLAPEYQPLRHEEHEQWMVDQEYIMIDTGSWTNVTGALAAGRLSAAARRAGHKVNTTHLNHPLKLTGVGEGRQVCHKELKIPICLKSMTDQQAGVHWYEAPVMHANNPADKAATCPAILGLRSLESLNAIIETSAAGPTLILPSEDGYVLTCHRATKYQLIKTPTGQLALPVHAFREISGQRSSGAFPKQSPAGRAPGRANHTAVNSIVATGRSLAPLCAPIWFPAKTGERCTRSDDFSGEPSRFPYASTEAMSQAMAAVRARSDSEDAERYDVNAPSSSGRTLAEVELAAAQAVVTAQAWLKRPRRD